MVGVQIRMSSIRLKENFSFLGIKSDPLAKTIINI